jgi:hypothetical protein
MGPADCGAGLSYVVECGGYDGYGWLGRVALVGGDCVVFNGWRVGSFGLC